MLESIWGSPESSEKLKSPGTETVCSKIRSPETVSRSPSLDLPQGALFANLGLSAASQFLFFCLLGIGQGISLVHFPNLRGLQRARRALIQKTHLFLIFLKVHKKIVFSTNLISYKH